MCNVNADRKSASPQKRHRGGFLEWGGKGVREEALTLTLPGKGVEVDEEGGWKIK